MARRNREPRDIAIFDGLCYALGLYAGVVRARLYGRKTAVSDSNCGFENAAWRQAYSSSKVGSGGNAALRRSLRPRLAFPHRLALRSVHFGDSLGLFFGADVRPCAVAQCLQFPYPSARDAVLFPSYWRFISAWINSIGVGISARPFSRSHPANAAWPRACRPL